MITTWPKLALENHHRLVISKPRSGASSEHYNHRLRTPDNLAYTIGAVL
jgi:hypothetical protein